MARVSKSKQAALDLIQQAVKLGWSVSVNNRDILTICKEYQGDDNQSRDGWFVECDSEYSSILSYATTSSAGSVWGTDGGGVGALSAIKHSIFTINKSGVNKHILSHIRKITA